MTPNSENAMARFLLAILNQKNLKDIDWEQVAQDPVLMQPITNGHAARMRFARFRKTISGDEPKKRNRTADNSRVTKSKKPTQKKRDSLESLTKSDSGISLASLAMHQASPQIKQENQHGYLAQFSPASTTSPYLTDNRDDINPRFLTPCSDDAAHGLVNPASLEDVRLRNGFGPSVDCNQDLLAQAPQNHLAMAQSPFHTFDAAYDFNSYRAVGDAQSPAALDLTGATSLADFTPDWSDNFHDQHPF
ncbi:hypothetical protein B0T10DRAFT_303682 [Thelonectria olida]|uniref:Myb-like DNA-binding domain-containing protein n=1 Tax=Thelonectria olida TaxID=1576542 RepID=A0A9P9AQW2_9HYPO|nr:hypothetical protein B0T10DRAFT_303682 [Thelonectria olida]